MLFRETRALRKLLMDELSKFIQARPDSRELKRALAVQMVLQDYRHREIQSVLQVSSKVH